MGFIQKTMHQMYLTKGETPLCVKEGGATDWEPRFAYLPTRMFNMFDGFGEWVWLKPYEQRTCRTAYWLHPEPAYWLECRQPESAD